jgi:predicted aminopeptidase
MRRRASPPPGMRRRAERRRPAVRVAGAAAVVLVVGLGGCASLSDGPAYYWQSMAGHLDVMRRAQPLDTVIAAPATDPALRGRLERAREIRAFASRELGLPDNGSYAAYADVRRPFVLWNVFATPELSLTMQRWCFPVAGCVSYRGYYDRDDAERYARGLREQGLDVQVGGVPAYSTLGWFDDPLLSTFVHYPEGDLARLVFHELAHQVLYVKGDTTFNESFATAVEEAGIERWFAARRDPEVERAYRAHAQRRRDFVALLRRHRDALEALYASPVSDDAKRSGKQAVFEALRADYAQLKLAWGGFAGYDRWFAQPLTNAHLAAVGAYNDLLPAFRVLLAGSGGDLPRFYDAVREIAALDPPARRARMATLAAQAPEAAPAHPATAAIPAIIRPDARAP